MRAAVRVGLLNRGSSCRFKFFLEEYNQILGEAEVSVVKLEAHDEWRGSSYIYYKAASGWRSLRETG